MRPDVNILTDFGAALLRADPRSNLLSEGDGNAA